MMQELALNDLVANAELKAIKWAAGDRHLQELMLITPEMLRAQKARLHHVSLI